MTDWKLVPVEPTIEMSRHIVRSLSPNAVKAWPGLLDVAPKASEDEALVERVALLARTDGSRARAVLKMLEGNHE